MCQSILDQSLKFFALDHRRSLHHDFPTPQGAVRACWKEVVDLVKLSWHDDGMTDRPSTLTFRVTTEHNAFHDEDSICEICAWPALYFFDALAEDGFVASYCRAHLLETLVAIFFNPLYTPQETK